MTVRDGCWASRSLHFPPLFVLHLTLFSERLLSWKVTHTRAAFFCFTFGLFYSLYGRSPRTVTKKKKEKEKKKLSNICLLFWGCGACDFSRFVLLLVCCGWQQCNSLSLACNQVIYLWHTILSDLHCVQYVTLTQTFTVLVGLILAAIPGRCSPEAVCVNRVVAYVSFHLY